MRAYLSGPITGLPEGNLPAFRELQAWLLANLDVAASVPHDIEPATHPGPCPDPDYKGATGGEHAGLCHVRADLVDMLMQDTVIMLPGWENSRGCNIERDLALKLGMPVLYWTGEYLRATYPPQDETLF